MRFGTVLSVVPVCCFLLTLPSGQCFIAGLRDSIAKTVTQARDSMADVGMAGVNSVMTGTKGLHSMVRFAADTLVDYHANSMESLKHGQKKTGQLLEDGVGSVVDMSSRVGGRIRDTAVTGTKKAAKHSVDFAKSGVDILNKAASGTSKTLRTALNEYSGKALDNMYNVPIVKPLLLLPHNLADITLEAVTDFSDEAASRTKNILDKVRPDDGEAD